MPNKLIPLVLFLDFFFFWVINLGQKEKMAGRNDSGASEKKSNEATNDMSTFNAENLQSNMKIIYYRFVVDILT